MEEWQKLLITSCSSFIVGALAETTRPFLAHPLKRRQIRRVLYRHLVVNFQSITSANEEATEKGEGWQDDIYARLGDLNLYPYEWASKSEAATFYTMPEAQGFDVMYDNIKSLMAETPATLERTIAGIAFTLEKLETNLAYGRLSRKEFNKAGQWYRKHVTSWTREFIARKPIITS
jgi:hypothetical protein